MMKNNLAKNTIILSICTLLNKGLLFVMIPLFSRWLTTSEFGDYDVYATYITLLIPLITLSCGDAVFRLAVDKKTDKEKKYYFTNGISIVFTNLMFSVLLLLLFGWILNWNVRYAFVVLLISDVLDNYFQSYLRALKKLNLYAYTRTISVVVISIMTTVLIKVFGLGLEGILYGYASGSLFSVIVTILVTKWPQYIDLKEFSFSGVKELLKYSYPLIPNSISWWFINVSDRTIIKVLLDASYNGIYGITCKIPNLCSSVFMMFSISWQEAAIDALNEKNRNEYYNNIYNKMITVLVSICIVLCSLNFFFFNFLFDIDYHSGYTLSAILLTSIIFSCISQFLGGLQIGYKNTKANGISTIIGALVNVVVHLVLIKYIGLYAAAISTLVSNFTVTIIRNHQLKGKTSLTVSEKTYPIICIYIYFIVASLYIYNLIFNLINLFVASLIFIVVNREYMVKIIRKVIKK